MSSKTLKGVKMATLKTFEEGDTIYASETNANNQALLSLLTDNAVQVQKYVEGEVASIKSNVASVQQTLQNNISEIGEIANSKISAEIAKGVSGFCKFSNGLIVQWGRTTSAFSGYRTINLPTPFTTSNYAPLACPLAGGDYDANWDVRNITNKSFVIGQHSSGSKNLTWIAIGY